MHQNVFGQFYRQITWRVHLIYINFCGVIKSVLKTLNIKCSRIILIFYFETLYTTLDIYKKLLGS